MRIDCASAVLKVWKPCAPAPRSARAKRLLLGRLDLLLARLVDLRLGRLLDDFGADRDQLAAQRKIVDQPGVVVDLGTEGRAVEQVSQIARAADLGELAVALEMFAQRHAVGDAAAGDHSLQHARRSIALAGA